jgi:hypothetical protein
MASKFCILMAALALPAPTAGFHTSFLQLARQTTPARASAARLPGARVALVSMSTRHISSAGPPATRRDGGGLVTRLRNAVLGICAAVRLDACMYVPVLPIAIAALSPRGHSTSDRAWQARLSHLRGHSTCCNSAHRLVRLPDPCSGFRQLSVLIAPLVGLPSTAAAAAITAPGMPECHLVRECDRTQVGESRSAKVVSLLPLLKMVT